ncbi:cobalt ECF transporter T component CbiQ [Desulfuromonas carbonis]|uniref:cobalt ECF transporter T component CbiQ n=1 Tax=Desulfuromonas sp. DDH964 TaxID=1823759 RepID=UPI00078DC1E2|nr:cobalt ECF transporter T component CbiQ [Desulfuromonas sp. DDH964]AMV73377.1 nickel ABC transporter membrane protein NikQ [Desulfuromonas sp. DDH964]
MAGIDSTIFDIGALDTLAQGDSAVHRLDPRAKLVTCLVFIVCVASFDKYTISALLPFLIFPLALAGRAGLPLGFLAKRLLVVAPFAIFIGIFNPLFDREILLQLGPLAISGGWVSFASILLRFVLTIGIALILVATTSFPGVCMALEGIGAPRVFAVQLLLLYRYLFVLINEAMRMVRARALRSFHGRGLGMKIFSQMVGQLLLRTLDRAQRVHLAMLCRGFNGEIRSLRRLHIGRAELLFTGGWTALFVLLRLVNLPQFLGSWVTELFR